MADQRKRLGITEAADLILDLDSMAQLGHGLAERYNDMTKGVADWLSTAGAEPNVGPYAHTPPKGPPGVSLEANIEEARRHRGNAWWFFNQVKPGGPWDYKRPGKRPGEILYEDFGNYHYGAVATAAGFPPWITLPAAGATQVAVDIAKEYGARLNGKNPKKRFHPEWIWGGSLGDEPKDQPVINNGIHDPRVWRGARR